MTQNDAKKNFYIQMTNYLLGTTGGLILQIIPEENSGNPLRNALEEQTNTAFFIRGSQGAYLKSHIRYQPPEKIQPSRYEAPYSIKDDREPSFRASNPEYYDAILSATGEIKSKNQISFNLQMGELGIGEYELTEIRIMDENDEIIRREKIERDGMEWRFVIEENDIKVWRGLADNQNLYLVLRRPNEVLAEANQALMMKDDRNHRSEQPENGVREISGIRFDREKNTVGIDERIIDWRNVTRNKRAEFLLPLAKAMHKEILKDQEKAKKGNWILELLYETYAGQADDHLVIEVLNDYITYVWELSGTNKELTEKQKKQDEWRKDRKNFGIVFGRMLKDRRVREFRKNGGQGMFYKVGRNLEKIFRARYETREWRGIFKEYDTWDDLCDAMVNRKNDEIAWLFLNGFRRVCGYREILVSRLEDAKNITKLWSNGDHEGWDFPRSLANVKKFQNNLRTVLENIQDCDDSKWKPLFSEYMTWQSVRHYLLNLDSQSRSQMVCDRFAAWKKARIETDRKRIAKFDVIAKAWTRYYSAGKLLNVKRTPGMVSFEDEKTAGEIFYEKDDV